METLEKRELLAAEVGHAIFAPGTPDNVVSEWESRIAPRGINQLVDPILAGSRWQTSALDTSPNSGDPITLTWGIVPDGTDILDPNTGQSEGTSDVVSFFDGIYGGSTEPIIANKPWFPIFENIYGMWADQTGLEFAYEPFDDGAALASADTNLAGVAGVRADMRIGGRFIDGNSNVLAFNYYPSASGNAGFDGDMVIDTGDNFYQLNNDGPSGRNVGLTNVLAHEVGHGLGIAHAEPVNQTKLMEPFVNFAFYGPQEDDFFNANTLYGDANEPNDSIATATDIGTLRNEVASLTNLSIDENNDSDLYRFDTLVATRLSIDLKPTGTRYDVGPQGGASSPVDRRSEANLGFRILDASGVELAIVENTAAGQDETITELSLDQAGTHYIEVFGAPGGTQHYDMDVRVGRTFSFQPDDGRLRLQSVNPNAGDLFDPNELNLELTAPTELKFRFTGDSSIDPASLADGIRITSVGRDGVSGTPDDVVISPGYLGFDENDHVVVARFAEPLVDGRYRIEVFGAGVPASDGSPLLAVDGNPFVPVENGTDRDIYDFELELGAKVLAVVPQPVVRAADGSLDPQRNKIEVYFDDLDLFKSEDPNNPGTETLKRPEFYQLIRTADTVSPGDDLVTLPDSIEVQEFEKRLVPDPQSPGNQIEIQVRVNRVVLTFATPDLADLPGEGAFRLKVGSSAPVRMQGDANRVTELNLNGTGDTVASAYNLALFGGTTVEGTPYSVNISSRIVGSGSPFDYPGADGEPGGRDIGEQQHFLGAGADGTSGIERRYFNFALNRPYGTLDDGRQLFTTINEEQMQRVREIFALYSDQFGVTFVESVDQGTTVVVGDLAVNGGVSGPGGTLGIAGRALAIMDAAEPWYNGFGTGPNPNFSFFEVGMHELGHSIGFGHEYELDSGAIMAGPGTVDDFVYPGKHDVVHGQYLFRPDNTDADFYSFTVPAGETGLVNAATFAERLETGSLLDTNLALYKRVGSEIVLLSSNDDSFGTDSALEFQVNEGEYFIAVTSTGNQDLDPTISGSGGGGNTQGDYELRLKFTPNSRTIVDAAGTPIDGDADGTPGGAFDFWFQADDLADTIYVDAVAPLGGDGSPANPVREIDTALAMATAGQTIRIVGNAGADNQIGEPSDNFAGANDNLAYEIGRIASLGRTLDDGRDLIVPAGVNVMLDAGAIFKMLSSRIAVGSNNSGTDASEGSLQVLGTPHLPVFFTSYNDPGVGLERSELQIDPSPGDWGGIEIRNDVDRAEGRVELERQGIFTNSITGADIRFGGGVVSVNGGLTSVAPIQLNAARPSLINNRITESGSAAISADPASFEETNFTTPFYQRGDLFTPDYSRIGPVMYGNFVDENAVNGVLIRIDTEAGGEKESLLVSARFDDTELVHVLGDDLIINGNPSGARNQQQATNPQLTVLAAVAAPAGEPGLAAGTYEYALSFIDLYGNETLVSNATRSVVVAAGLAVQLQGLPSATSNYVSRRLYRRVAGTPTFGLVAELDRTSPNYLDALDTPTIPALTSGDYISEPDARLRVDPGVIIKSDGVRIETGFGGDLIAEGTLGTPIIFTSRSDDRYGTGGTFDTSADGVTEGASGDWAGLYIGPTSLVSLDHARLAFGGGRSTIDGTSSGFNALQIYQAEARVANTVFEASASGVAGTDAQRAGRGPNTPAVVYVNGAEPILVGNRFIGTTGGNTAAISFNVNDLNGTIVEDTGRQTGSVDLFSSDGGNHGPLVRGNTLEAAGLAGMVVRGDLMATAGIWDDTDIVHIVDGSVTDSNQHHYGGLRLQSRIDESLVVKFLDAGGTLTATGKNLDIQTRVGGTLQVIGQPDYPVVLTTIDDDTVGAGFDINGAPLTDNGGDGDSVPTSGSWKGIELLELANDRNVETITEAEALVSVGGDLNGTPASADVIGQLATGEKASDENLRLGFTIHGAISTDLDQDVYSFRATAGTEIWLDIDRTSATLDSVVELVGLDGTVLAASDNSVTETTSVSFGGGIALPMRESLFAPLNSNGSYQDLYSTNPLDAGMRLTLPGNLGASREYFVRVRGARGSVGLYELQIRLREADEFAGSTVRHSEIRYAQTGIETRGLPYHSLLTGEGGTAGPAIDLGNIGATDRGTISVSGDLANPNSTNRYRFTVARKNIQSGGNAVSLSATFDLDYADGLGRPDTTLLLYSMETNPPTLVMMAQDSNVVSDQASPLQGTDLDDLSRGSAGTQDPFLGTVELAAGDYEIVVVNNARMPSQLNQLVNGAPSNPDIRVEPVNSVLRIAEDRFDTRTPLVTAAAPVQTVVSGNANVVPFSLGDVDLMVLESDANSANQTQLESINAATGNSNGLYHENNLLLGEIISRPNGSLLAFTGAQAGNETDANTGATYFVDPATGTRTAAGTLGLTTFTAGVDANGNIVVNQAITSGTTNANGNGMLVTAVVEQVNSPTDSDMFIVAKRGNGANPFVGLSSGALAVHPGNNYVYRVDPDSGAVVNANQGAQDRVNNARGNGAGTQKIEVGRIDTPNGEDIVGTAIIGNTLYAFSEDGFVAEIPRNNLNSNPSSNTLRVLTPSSTTDIGVTNFVSATPAPAEVPGYENIVLLITGGGDLYAYDVIARDLVGVLSRSSEMVASDASSVRSITFSRTQENLWHVTNRTANLAADDPANKVGSSLYFGYEDGPNEGTYNTGSHAHGQFESDGFDLSEYDSADQPMLYFDYFLDTEDLEAFMLRNNVARDSLRVFVSSEESRDWTLVATNNGSQAGTFNDPNLPGGSTQNYDEFDVAINGYRDENGKGYVARELYDATDWRQARVPLAPWAGHRDVRIRFDFNSAGESERYVADLRAVEAKVILKAAGNREFELRHDPSGDTETFEFDFGTVLQAPAGSAISDGDQFTVDGTTFTFLQGTSVGTLINYSSSMTADQVANQIRIRLGGNGFITRADPSHASRFSVNATTFSAAQASLQAFMSVEQAGVAAGNIPVPIAIDASIAEIQSAMQLAIAEGFNQGASPANLTPYQLYRDSVRMYGFTVLNPGVLGFFQNDITTANVNSPPGQDAGVYPRGNEFSYLANNTARELQEGQRADNNNFRGVFIDDIVIGFAERGEAVSNAAPSIDLQDNPYHEATTGTLGNAVDQIDAGEFQLGIRLSAEYEEVTTEGGDIDAVRTFDTNDVIGQSVGLQFGTAANPLSGAEIPDGAFVQISDSVKVLRFEFDNVDLGISNDVTPGNIAVAYTSDMTATEIATALRDAINDPAVQADFKVFATSTDGTVKSNSATMVHLQGPAASNLLGGSNFAPSLSRLSVVRFGTEFTFQGTPFGFDGGDVNSFRDQGQIVLQNNVILDSQNYGIDIDAGPRRSDLPSPGSSQAFTTDNPDDLIPGVVVMNSVFVDNRTAGIRLGGDTQANSDAANQFARLINNTIVGGNVGIIVTENASPTLINNAIANTGTGIDASGAGSIELFATLFLNNSRNAQPNNLNLGAFPVLAGSTDVVFTDLNNRDLYPAALSLLIDNSVGAVNDRPGLLALKNSLGISGSPIIAPVRDISGQPRAAAPNNNGGGTGNNIFIDIGAFDRSDLIGPFASLLDPLDNGPVDSDVADSFVRVISGTLDRFEIQILDQDGAGLDDASVSSEKLNLTQDGRLLVAGVDYTFGYSETNNTILLTPASGIWNPSSAYEITLNNRSRTIGSAPSGIQVLDGEQFSIQDVGGTTAVFEFDSGFILDFTANPIADGDTLIYRSGNSALQIEFNDIDLPPGPTDPATTTVIDFSVTDPPEQLAFEIGEAFRNAAFLDLANAREFDETRVYVGGAAGDSLTINSTGLMLSGSAGVSAGAIPVAFIPSSAFTAETMAGQIIGEVFASPLNVPAFTPGGGLLYFENIARINGQAALSGLPNADIEPILDIAGNRLEPNRSNRETQFTILMPDVRLDFGDAILAGSSTYPTTLAQNGARHTVSDSFSPLLGSVIDTELDFAGSDDVIVSPITASGTGGLLGTVTGNVASISVNGPASGDTLTVDVGGTSRTYELVLATQPAAAGNIAVLYVPGAPDAITAQRLAAVIVDDMAVVNPLIDIVYERGSTAFDIQSVDDEDGVLVGSVMVNGNQVDGLFLDTDGSPLGFLNPSSPTGTQVIVNTTGNGLLDAWVDFNGDGDFTDPGEQVLRNQAMLDGQNRITINTPSDPAILASVDSAETWIRFRLSNAGNTTSDGVVVGGEVEDYKVLIADVVLPEPKDDFAGATLEDTAIEIVGADLLANDAANGVSPLTINLERDVLNGELVFNNDPIDPRWTYTPELDFYGTETFIYSLGGTAVVNGQTLPVRSSSVATVTITVTPVNDAPTASDHNQFEVLEPVDSAGTSIQLTNQDLLAGALPKAVLTPAQALDPGSALLPPWDESEQSLSVIQISVVAADGSLQPVVSNGTDIYDLVDGTFTADTHLPDGAGGFLTTGSVTVTVSGNEIVDVSFAPHWNYNEDNPVVPAADDFTFVYTIADDAATTLPDGSPASPLPSRETAQATVSIRVVPQNDSPVTSPDLITQVGGTRLDEDVVGFRIDSGLILANDLPALPSTVSPFFFGADDEINGLNQQTVELVTMQGATATVALGSVGGGIAVHENATGTGYILHSPQSVFTRFASSPPPTLPSGTASDQMVAVRYAGNSWQYSDDTTWVNFAPVSGDRLLAAVDFDQNEITSLQYTGGQVNGIPQGFITDSSTGPLTFTANEFGGVFDLNEFTVSGTEFKVSTDPDFPAEFRGYDSRPTEMGGTLTYDSSTGELVYTPATDFYGTDSFTYVIRDVPVNPSQPHHTLYAVGTVTLEVYPVNDAPLAQDRVLDESTSPADDRRLKVRESELLTVTAADLLQGAIPHAGRPTIGTPQDESGQVLNVVSLTVSDLQGATTVITSDGVYQTPRGTIHDVRFDANGFLIDFIYEAGVDFNADNPLTAGDRTEDWFEFTIQDSDQADWPQGGTRPVQPLQSSATATILVTPQNDAPAVGDDRISADPGSDWTIYFGNNPAPVPTEGSANQMMIPLAFLTQNDLPGPLTAGDENAAGGYLNDSAALLLSLPTQTTSLGGTVEILDQNGNLFVLYTPPEDAFGVDTFLYTATDSGIDEDTDGTRVDAPLSSDALVSILVTPSNDVPVSFDRVVQGIEDETTAFTADDLLGIGSAQPTLPIVADPNRDPLFNESEQIPNLRVVAITVGDQEFRSSTAPGSPIQLSYGTLELTFAGDAFVSGLYTPTSPDNNELIGVDEFNYIVADDGTVAIPDSGTFFGEPNDRMVTLPTVEGQPRRVTLPQTPVNDDPVFVEPPLNILERDDIGVPTVFQWATNIMGGPVTAQDEQSQVVHFQMISFSDPLNLFYQPPVLDRFDGTVDLYPDVDQFGQATMIVAVNDSEYLPNDPSFQNPQVLRTITINLQPVNDPPRINPDAVNVAAANPLAPTDDAYGVAADGSIRYVLKENNVDNNGVGSPYVIPVSNPDFLSSITSGDYQRPGLLDVFIAGPDNEISGAVDNANGGSQSLSLVDLFAGASSLTTDKNGTLEAVRDGQGEITALLYTPSAEFNKDIGGLDSFRYSVTDDGVSFVNGNLVPDPRTISGRVSLSIEPVNSKPIFTIAANPAEVLEDSGVKNVSGFASNISPGPLTATDEVGQDVEFHVTPTSFDPADIDTLFVQRPTITRDGTLIYQTAANVYGIFEFQVHLCDSGLTDSLDAPCVIGTVGANDRGDSNQSEPATFTLSVLPVNDVPTTIDGNAPPAVVVVEDGSILLSIGSSSGYDLLGAYHAGPENETTPTVFGGQTLRGQTVSLDQSQFPTSTQLGVPLEPVLDQSNQLIGYRYQPPANYAGGDQLVYAIRDNGQSVQIGAGLVPFDDSRVSVVTVPIQVTPVNDPPVSGADDNPDGLNVFITEGDGAYSNAGWMLGVAVSPFDAVDEIRDQKMLPPTLTEISNQIDFTSPPQVQLSGDRVSLQFEAEENGFGLGVYVVTLSDDGGTPGDLTDDATTDYTFTISVEGVNDPPTFDGLDRVDIQEDSPAYSGQYASNIDVGPGETSQTITRFDVTVPAGMESLFSVQPTVSAAGLLTFTPAPDAAGEVVLSITAVDSEDGHSTPHDLIIFIQDINDAPVANDDPITVDEDEVMTLDVSDLLSNDTDPDLNNRPPFDTEVLTIQMATDFFSSQGARVRFDSSTGEIVYDPTTSAVLDALMPGQSIVDTFSYTLTDGELTDTGMVSLTVTGTNDAPRLGDDTFNILPGTATELPVLGNDVDVDSAINPSSIIITTQPTQGALEVAANGRLIYTPLQGYRGPDEFRYTVADTLGQQSKQATVSLRVGLAPATMTVNTGTSINVPIDIDALDGVAGQPDPATMTIVSGPQNGSAVVLASGEIRYTPDTDYLGADVIVFTVADPSGFVSDETTININVVESSLQNPVHASDVNASGTVTPLDALLVINRLAIADSSGSIPVLPTDHGPNYYDQNGDLAITSRDALAVINELALQRGSGSGEGFDAPTAVLASPLSDVIAAVPSSQPTTRGNDDQPMATENAVDKIVSSEVLTPVDAGLIDLISVEDEDDDSAASAIDEALVDLLS
ncbi:tandem-95 repeat protein [Stieleria tagensis]|uniref:tandem-95 repeat protein n=1 Tax=Stieleria tagensis TaxID=2956795 RepID=UPI00209AE16C|nr:tandem-95 repeat protein [Stieleria tagensis]